MVTTELNMTIVNHNSRSSAIRCSVMHVPPPSTVKMENHAHFTFAELKWGICILFPIVNFLGRRHVIGQSQLLASHVSSHEYVSEYHQCSR